MGFFSPEGESHLELIVYFLSESLRAAIETGDELQQTAYQLPKFTPGMDCSEIAESLAELRQQVGELWSLEVAVLTKILRARDLAKELRMHEPALKPEIDTFRLATVMAADLLDKLMPNDETVFNGAVQPRKFLTARCQSEFGDLGAEDAFVGYKIAGQFDVRLLLDACAALHFSLSARYGFEAPALALQSRIVEDAQIALIDADAEEPFLLSDWGEIVSDAPSPSSDRRLAFALANQPLPH